MKNKGDRQEVGEDNNETLYIYYKYIITHYFCEALNISSLKAKDELEALYLCKG